MYPRNAASPERIAVGAVVQISDGAVQTSGVSISVRGQGGASGAGAGTTAYDNGIVEYTPTQAETDYTSFIVVAYKTGCIPVATTIVTSASATAGYAGTDQSKIANPTATVNLSGTSISTSQVVASVSGAVGSVTGAVGSVTGNVSGNVTGSVGSVMGLTVANLDVAVSSRLATAGYTAPDNASITGIKAKTDSLTFTVAGQVDSNIQYVNDVVVQGDGSPGNEWGP